MTEHTNPTEQAVHWLQTGEVIAYPTEAVYGLGCDPDNQQAVMKLLAMKQRPVEKGLILIAANYSQLLPYIDDNAIAPERRAAIFSSWPGHISWVLPASSKAPRWLTGKFDTIAVRVSAHPVVQQLCLAFGKPLVSTSANLAGEPAFTEAQALAAQWGSQLAMIVPGALGGATKPSQIRDAVSGEVLRS
ncbi:L-threonylcarbamoyladenylate synthase [Chromatiaceae bacterium AAb-1]|nr:L-threonylcarbamoyladenylate synthase [Chromatiaceae bacterium AAb-1]